MNSIVICLQTQTLQWLGESPRQYSVSTATRGGGEIENSFKTPRGQHAICEKIGEGMPVNTVFRGRRPTGEIYSPELAKTAPRDDWILTRILWLEGREPGKNLGENRDTRRRYIYIHGAPDSATMGRPGSIGCIRMRNNDILELFALAQVGDSVNIIDGE